MTLYYLVEFVDENNAIGITRSEWVRLKGCTDFTRGSMTYTSWPAKDYSAAIQAKDAFAVRLHNKVFQIHIKERQVRLSFHLTPSFTFRTPACATKETIELGTESYTNQ